MKVSVSIVTYCTPEALVGRAVEAINCERRLEASIILVDNSPLPMSYASTLARWGNVAYRFAGRNLGYGAGHNLGASCFEAATFQYHLVLNPDVYWNGDVLTTLLDYLDRNCDVALVMPHVRYPDGATQYLCKLLPSPFDLLVRRFLPAAWFPAARARYELRFTGYRSDMNVPYLSGCFMCLRRAAFDGVGGFDERFFMYPEDIDLTRRLHRRWRTMFFAGATVYHEHARSSYRSSWMLAIHAWNIARYFWKWGWFFDRERRAVNRKVLADVGEA